MSEPEEVPRAPWGYRLFLVVAALYLGLRLVQAIEWVWRRLVG